MVEISVQSPVFEFDGVAPSGHGKRLIRLKHSTLMQSFEDACNREMLLDGFLAVDVCREGPDGVWQGLGRPELDLAYCYAGRASGKFASDNGIDRSLQPDETMIVFLTPDMEIAKWRRATMDLSNPGFPLGHDTRFGRRLWPL